MASIRRVRPPLARLANNRASLDITHPLARGMADCLIWNTMVPFNLATPTAPITLTSSPTVVTTIEGTAGYATGGSYYSSPDHGNMVAGDFTARVRFIPVGLPDSYNTLFSKNAAGNRELAVFLNSSLQLRFLAVGGPAIDNINLGSFTLGQVHDLVLRRSDTTANVAVFQNGLSLGNAAVVGYSTSPFPAALTFGNDAGGTAPDVKFIAFNHWNRALSNAEIFQLYQDPYGFLTYAPDARRVGAAAAAGFLAAWARGSNLPVIGTGTY